MQRAELIGVNFYRNLVNLRNEGIISGGILTNKKLVCYTKEFEGSCVHSFWSPYNSTEGYKLGKSAALYNEVWRSNGKFPIITHWLFCDLNPNLLGSISNLEKTGEITRVFPAHIPASKYCLLFEINLKADD